MPKVVINDCYGGFSLSDAAFEWLIANRGWNVRDMNDGTVPDTITTVCRDAEDPLGGKYWSSWYDSTGFRVHPDVIAVVEELGDRANGMCARLKIVEIPDDVEFEVCDYDGHEWIAENHRIWR